jgi:hypothetical protein
MGVSNAVGKRWIRLNAGKTKEALILRFRRSEPLFCVPQEGIEPPTGGLEGRCSIP